jgi:hypothetical protein
MQSIVWLDYTEKLNRGILEDIRFVVSQATRWSVLVWSVNAEPWGDDEGTTKIKSSEMPEHRLNKLRESVGKERVPSSLKGSELGLWGLASVYRDIIIDEVRSTLNNRNAPAADMDRLHFRQFLNFRYRDGQRMLTVGGVLLNDSDEKVLGPDAFAELFFVREGTEAFDIEPPMLTSRELRHLNKQMPNGPADLVPGLTDDEIESYKKVYRYYPVFAEAEL